MKQCPAPEPTSETLLWWVKRFWVFRQATSFERFHKPSEQTVLNISLVVLKRRKRHGSAERGRQWIEKWRKREDSCESEKKNGSTCRGQLAGMTSRALTLSSEQKMKRRTVVLTHKSEKRALLTWKVDFAEYPGQCRAQFESLIFSPTKLFQLFSVNFENLEFNFLVEKLKVNFFTKNWKLIFRNLLCWTTQAAVWSFV